jgi:hypothetical protein
MVHPVIVLPEKEANSLHVGEVLRRTNPALANTIAHRAELEDAVRTGAETRDGLDPRVALAFAKISDLDRRDQRVIEWHAALTQWSNLDEPARSRLLNEINAKVAEQQRRLDCIHFVRLMTTRFKPDVGGLFQMLPIVMPVFVGLALLLFYAKHSKNHLVPVLLGSFVGAFVFGLLVNGFLRRQMHKRFFRKVLLPESEVRNIDIGGVMDLLGQVDVHDQRIDPRVSAMAKSLPLLKGLLAEQNRYLELQPQ